MDTTQKNFIKWERVPALTLIQNAMMAERMAACSKLTTAHRTVQAQTDVHKRSVMYVDEDSEDEAVGHTRKRMQLLTTQDTSVVAMRRQKA
jgi:hypothetical protein